MGGRFLERDHNKMAKEVKVRSPLRSPLRSPSKPKEWDASAVGSDDYLASLTRRLDVVEKKLVGARGFRKEYRPLVPAVQVRICQVTQCHVSNLHHTLLELPAEVGRKLGQ